MTQLPDDTTMQANADAWFGLETQRRALVRRTAGDLVNQVADLRGSLAAVRATGPPEAFLHPSLLVQSVNNRWAYRAASSLVRDTARLPATTDLLDDKTVGGAFRTRAMNLVSEAERVLDQFRFVSRFDTTDPASRGDPLASARDRMLTALMLALTVLEAPWSEDDADRDRLSASVETMEWPEPEPDWAVINAVQERIARPTGREPLVRFGEGILRSDEPARAGDPWGLELPDLRSIGAGYRSFAQLEEFGGDYTVGRLAIRMCLDTADPLLAHFAALRLLEVARGAAASDPQALSDQLARFWSERAPLVVDRGAEEGAAYERWRSGKDPRQLVKAHGELLEAVGRPLLSAALAVRALGKGNPAEEFSPPPELNEVVERCGSARDEELFDLVARSVHMEARRAGAHSGVTREIGGAVTLEDGRGNEFAIELDELHFDHLMLRSLLVGVEAGLGLASIVAGLPPPVSRPRIRHNEPSFEVALRNELHRRGARRVAMNWDRKLRSLTVRAERLPGHYQCRAAAWAVMTWCDPAVMPSGIIFAPRPPQSQKSKRKRRKKR